ncbi:SDR family oxidoreductase [Proteiniborus sp. MB09-C3]|uniref:SDR family oxidoreductase n=1 Tax=Proteiniborus sp. MB09-C3 TaxID=3050072 RepID=UPI002554424D|nr:SDR family oxidoreductase [Proteiniborus sp. MB09-C3]WIV11201.1 SDR family oxidoreductase [Proteiniborus sp. MB09-C3]
MKNRDYKFYENTRLLVTGGAGFIGSNIAEKLLSLGLEVTILDNFSTGKIENIEHLLSNSKLQLIDGDIRDINDCNKACKDIDYVLHNAALGSVPRSMSDPKTTNDVNISGTLNMLIASKDNNIKRFVYASSSSVYGDNENLPKQEENKGKPLSPYAITKVTNEMYGRIFHDNFKLPTIGLRYFNVFGKNQDFNSQYAAVIPSFIKKIILGESPVIWGDGSQTRDFTFVENVVEANIRACLASDEATGNVFNIATGNRVSILDLLNEICDILEAKVSPIFMDWRAGDVMHSFANIEKAKKLINYTPIYDFKSGIKKTINWYLEKLR